MGSSRPREHDSSSSIPWREMFQTAATPQPSIPQVLRLSRSSSALSESGKKNEPEIRSFKRLPLYSRNEEGANDRFTTTRIANAMGYSTGTLRGNNVQLRAHSQQEAEEEEKWKFSRVSFQLAIYIAMAHAGLIFLALVLYGVWRLLEDYRKPIQWAVLCSMPLRKIQEALVTFWEPPLRKGLVETLLAIPLATYKALSETLMDALVAIHGVLGRVDAKRRKVEFSLLMQWLLSFWILTLSYEYLGAAMVATIGFVGMIAYAAGTSAAGLYNTWLCAEDIQQRRQARSWFGWMVSPIAYAYKLINSCLTRPFVRHLRTVIAIWLIFILIVGSMAGLIVFSYKIGLEGKDVMVDLKMHVQKSNYTEKVRLRQWIEDNNIPEVMGTYTAKAYQIVSEQIDVFAAQYNMTHLANEGKKHLLRFAGRKTITNINASESPSLGSTDPVLEGLRKIRARFREYDFKGVCFELRHATIVLLEHFHLSREDIIGNLKQVGQRWSEVGKQVVSSSSTLFTGSTNILLSIGSSIASGAAEIINFITQAIVFFSLLYYLITSESGGVMDQVLGMVPLSDSTRKQCATVLDHTVSSLLLATAKAAIFQAVFTWLLFRFLSIHFLYMSTMLAFFSAVLPIIPSWLPSLLGGAQLALGGKYIQAVLLMIGHMWVSEFGVSAIQDGIPGYNAYLTGLSIAGGMALFSPALEGAIMGPLIMTVLISVKDLYSEFVLGTAKN